MPRSWPIYTYIALAALLGVAVPLGMDRLTRALRGKTAKSPGSGSGTGRELGSRINLRFFSGASVAALGIIAIFLMIPILLSLRTGDHPHEGMILACLLLIFLAVGFFYSARKGDLSWLRSSLERPDENGDGS